MGRYYSGDIEGKFWVALQPSDDADFFGVSGEQSNELYYYFSKEDEDKVAEGVKKCEAKLLGYKDKIKEFFDTHMGYTDEELSEYLDVTKEKVETLLAYYARLSLGEKILKCIKENGSCEFTAEI